MVPPFHEKHSVLVQLWTSNIWNKHHLHLNLINFRRLRKKWHNHDNQTSVTYVNFSIYHSSMFLLVGCIRFPWQYILQISPSFVEYLPYKQTKKEKFYIKWISTYDWAKCFSGKWWVCITVDILPLHLQTFLSCPGGQIQALYDINGLPSWSWCKDYGFFDPSQPWKAPLPPPKMIHSTLIFHSWFRFKLFVEEISIIQTWTK